MTSARILVVEDENITAEDIGEGLVKMGYEVSATVSTGEDAIKKAEELSPDLIIMDIRLKGKMGYEVSATVSTGEDAIKKAEELSPDLIIMDIRLKGKMDGIEAAEEIRRRFGIPVIYLTAYFDENTVERAKITEPSGYIIKGDSSFLNKPFDEGELHTAIEITLYKHKMELRLRKNQQQLYFILKNVSDAVISTDSRRMVRLINSKAEDITGWLEEEAIGSDLMEVLHPFSGQLGLLDMEDVSMARPLELYEEVIENKNGDRVTINGTLNPEKDENGNIEGWVIVFNLS